MRKLRSKWSGTTGADEEVDIEQKEVSCRGVTVSVGLYTLLVIPQHDRD
jgi:hypothetical protein